MGLAIWGCGRCAPIASGNPIAFPTPLSPSGCLCGDRDTSTGAEAGIGERRGRGGCESKDTERETAGRGAGVRVRMWVRGCVARLLVFSLPSSPVAGPGARCRLLFRTAFSGAGVDVNAGAAMSTFDGGDGRGSGGRWEGAVCGLSLVPVPLNTPLPSAVVRLLGVGSLDTSRDDSLAVHASGCRYVVSRPRGPSPSIPPQPSHTAADTGAPHVRQAVAASGFCAASCLGRPFGLAADRDAGISPSPGGYSSPHVKDVPLASKRRNRRSPPQYPSAAKVEELSDGEACGRWPAADPGTLCGYG